ncbi:MAG: hypothetical protein FJ220_03975, partial [Kiritimatiellaceae bacterium]|nr:hypothetical protein [Kiritimatiellaceae bacterium]
DKPDDQSLRLTLIHSPDTAEWEDETLDRGRVKEMRWQDWGRHEFNYAIAGHAGDWRKSTHQEAMRFEQRPAAFAVSKTSGAKTSLSLLNINSQQVNVQAVKMAEDKSGVIIRLQELTGKPCEGIQLSSMIPVSKAEEMDGVERPLNKPLKVANNTLSLDFTPYQIRTILLKVQDPDAKPLTTPVQLTYDTDVFSYNSNREDGYGTKEAIKGRKEHLQGSSGSFDGKGGTYPAEMIGDTVTMGNVLFNIGPRTDMSYNAVACRGQTIALPEGTTVIHLLAAADVDTDVVFKAGAKEFPLTIGGWSDNIGQWDKRVFKGFVAELSYSLRNDLVRIDPGFIRDQRIGWFASHRHLPAGDTLYEYGHLFAYSLDIPEGANSLTLPQSPFVRIVAISTGDEGFAKPLQSPFQDLHRDAEFVTKFSKP